MSGTPLIHLIGPGIPPLDPGLQVGGKAAGLSHLIEMGANVPPALVLTGADPDNINTTLLNQIQDHLGTGPLAVRSSASAEDGAESRYRPFQPFSKVRNSRVLSKSRLFKRSAHRAHIGSQVGRFVHCVPLGHDIRAAVLLLDAELFPQQIPALFAWQDASDRALQMVL